MILYIYNQCSSDAHVRLGKQNSGSHHLCNSILASASPGCGSPAAHTDFSPPWLCSSAHPTPPCWFSDPSVSHIKKLNQQKTIFSILSVFCPFQLPEAACQRLQRCQHGESWEAGGAAPGARLAEGDQQRWSHQRAMELCSAQGTDHHYKLLHEAR